MPDTVVHVSDSLLFGGTEQVILQLMRGLPATRWKCVLFHEPTPHVLPLVAHAQALGVEHYDAETVLSRARLAGIIPLIRRLRAIRPSVVHAHLTHPLACRYTLAAAALAGVPALVATSHLFAELPPGWLTTQHKALSLIVHRYIAVSQGVADKLHGSLRVPRRKIRVVRNGVRCECFQQSAGHLRATLTGGKDVPVILTLARLDPQKGLPFLLDAARQVPDAIFLIAGDGPDKAVLDRMAQRLGVSERVHLLGHRADVPDLLASCDMLVLPSLYEGLPLAVLEAMAAGKPVVATSIPGVDEAVVNGQTGLMVPPTDATSLATAIRTLIDDPELARRLGANGRTRVRAQFGEEVMVRGVAAVYDELLS